VLKGTALQLRSYFQTPVPGIRGGNMQFLYRNFLARVCPAEKNLANPPGLPSGLLGSYSKVLVGSLIFIIGEVLGSLRV